MSRTTVGCPRCGKDKDSALHDTNNGVTWTHWTEEAKKRFEEQNPGVEIEVLAMGRTQLLERVVTLWVGQLASPMLWSWLLNWDMSS